LLGSSIIGTGGEGGVLNLPPPLVLPSAAALNQMRMFQVNFEKIF
jgi:hypothetical protein